MNKPDSAGTTGGGRAPGALEKLERLNKTLRHEEPDRVPIGEFFWGAFTRRWREDLGLPADADPYRHYDLDWIVTTPNMDPWIRPFETLRESAEEVVVRTGFGALLHKRFAFPMPEMRSWEIDTLDKLERAEFDAPDDPHRFFASGDNQIAGVGDGFQRDVPAWIDTVRTLRTERPVYGSIIEANECLTRLVGQHNAMLWMGEAPERMGEAIDRLGAFYVDMAEAALDAGNGLLDGLVIWGDVAHKHGMFMSPAYWRTHFKPCVAAMVDRAHARRLPVIYHGCGNIHAILADLIEIGVDACNPLEAKAGMDAVDLRRRHGHQIAFCGNRDMRVWEEGDRDRIRREVLRKLNAARGGGYIFQSDHSVSSAVSGATYDFIVGLVREHGRYPLRLAELDEAD